MQIRKMSFCAIASVALIAFPLRISALSYTINFSDIDATNTIDSVVVKNLTKGTKATIASGNSLTLTDATGISSIQNDNLKLRISPNPISEVGNVSFEVPKTGNVDLAIVSMDGRVLYGHSQLLIGGKNSCNITAPNGEYLLKISGQGFSETVKVLSKSTGNTVAQLSDIISENNDNNTNAIYKSQNIAPNQLLYSNGDQIIYMAYSGKKCSVLTDKPNSSKTASFKFESCTDADGNNYSTVTIGKQVWMVENLRTTKYANGDSISISNDNMGWMMASKGKVCSYKNTQKVDSIAKFGRLYNWLAATDPRGIAPQGWQVPSDSDWVTLGNYLIANGYNYDKSTTGNQQTNGNYAAAIAGNTDWTSFSDTGIPGENLKKNNASGFSASPAGLRNINGTYSNVNDLCGWWSSSAGTAKGTANYIGITYYSTSVLSNGAPLQMGLSIRCVKNVSK